MENSVTYSEPPDKSRMPPEQERVAGPAGGEVRGWGG